MTMQLFSFGHPCEHQLRRTCIGGSSCPLNGYPDNWCCSFIKGKINFKRDKPCEGPRCRWGFTHPSQAQFDAVTQVLNESRPIAAKIDDADDKEMLTFSIENARIVDTVQCALHMMRHPPSNCTTRVGQLLAYAALRAGDVKVFMQLLKTMKKPVDGYLLGAYEYLTSGNLPTLASSNNNNTTNNNNSNSNSNNNNSNSAQSKGSGKKGGSADKKEDTVDELKNDMVDLMNAALSSGGQLVNREDQHTLQAVFIQALRSYPKSNKKRQEMLELAVAKFGNRQVPKNPSAVAAAVLNSNNSNANTTTTTANANATTTTTAAANTNNTNNTTTGHSPAAAAASGTTTTTTPTTAAAVVAAGSAAAAAAAAATGTNINTNTTNTTTAATTAAAVVAAGTPGKTVSSTIAAANAAAGSGQSPKAKESTEDDGTVNHHGGSSINNNNNAASARRPQAVGGTTTTTATIATTPTTTFTASARLKDMANPSPAKPQTQQTQPPQPQPQPVVGISRLAMQVKQAPVRHYEPIRTDLPLPNIALFGGLFGLTVQSATWALLGSASSHKIANTTNTTTTNTTNSLATNTVSAVAAPSLTTATVVAGALTNTITMTTATSTTTTTNASPIPHPGVLPLELAGGVDDKVFGFLGSHAADYSFFSDIDGVADD